MKRSALAQILVWAAKYLHYGGNRGFRWPAVMADDAAPWLYKGPNPNLNMGSLLAIPPWVSAGSLGVNTDIGMKFFWTLQARP